MIKYVNSPLILCNTPLKNSKIKFSMEKTDKICKYYCRLHNSVKTKIYLHASGDLFLTGNKGDKPW